jgi:hypothetical protein
MRLPVYKKNEAKFVLCKQYEIFTEHSSVCSGLETIQSKPVFLHPSVEKLLLKYV